MQRSSVAEEKFFAQRTLPYCNPADLSRSKRGGAS
jgi:hypothetical protein